MLLLVVLLRSIDCLAILGADAVDSVVLTTVVSVGVEEGVNVKSVVLGSSGELTKSDSKLLDSFGVNIVLGAENNNTTLGDYFREMLGKNSQSITFSKTHQ